MKTVTIRIGDEDLKNLSEIFVHEEQFKPQTKEDRLIVEILRQVLNNPKTEIIEAE